MDTLLAIFNDTQGWDAAVLALTAFLLFVIASNVVWRVAASNSPTAKQLRQATVRPPVRAAVELLRFVYYIGVPFVALYLGWLDLRSVGLGLFDVRGTLDWADGIRWAIVILLAAWLILIVIWLPFLRATTDVFAPPDQPTFARRMVELFYMQSHWMFYRAAAIVFFTGVLPDALLWGTIVGLGVVALEALLDPRVRSRMTRLGEADGVLWNFGQAVINTLAFAVTRNLILLVVIQFVLEMTVPHLRPTREPQRQPGMASVLRKKPTVRG